MSFEEPDFWGDKRTDNCSQKKNYEYFINVNLLQVVTVPWLRTDFVNNYALCDKCATLGGHKQQPISLRGCFETDCHL